jgi:RimJ/RimL family protein N-acetyltransferase
MFIRTERLFLRPGWPEDLEELREVLGNEEAAMRDSSSRSREPFLAHFFINLRDDDGPRLIGGIGLAKVGSDVELDFWVAPRHRGQGYAAEAVRAVLRQAAMLGHDRVIAMHFADNAASARVLEQAGFAPTGKTCMRFNVERGVKALAQVYRADLRAADGDQPAFAAFKFSQAGATSGVISSTRKWSTANPSAG